MSAPGWPLEPHRLSLSARCGELKSHFSHARTKLDLRIKPEAQILVLLLRNQPLLLSLFTPCNEVRRLEREGEVFLVLRYDPDILVSSRSALIV